MTNDTDDEILSKLNPGIAGTSFFTNCGRPAIKKVPEKTGRKLARVPFKVSRLMEFCTRRELVNQTGHDVYEWALVVQKELLDNALDAAEEAEIAPVVIDRSQWPVDRHPGQRSRHSGEDDRGHPRLQHPGFVA